VLVERLVWRWKAATAARRMIMLEHRMRDTIETIFVPMMMFVRRQSIELLVDRGKSKIFGIFCLLLMEKRSMRQKER
jgi:hypothetical protein